MGHAFEMAADPKIAILILAAGQSSRMRGADKMLELVDGEPLIHRQARIALATGLPVWVTLPPEQPLRAAALVGLPLISVLVETASWGISQSIIAGNEAIPSDYGVILWLADLPEIETTDLQLVATAAGAAPLAIVRATTEDGKPGHPVYIPSLLRRELTGLSGDDGARELLKRHVAQTVFVRLLGNRALTDLDTPEEWAQWRARRQH
jgi:molybdenum cofactor cytidylyltransferase